MGNNLEEKMLQYSENLFVPQNVDYLNYLCSERNFHEDTLKRFAIGLNTRNQITIPIHKQGEIVGFKYRRSPFSEEGAKYINPKGIGNTIFNASTLTDYKGNIIVSEGEFDVMSLEQYGLRSICQTTGAGFPIKYIEPIIGKLPIENIIFALDNDEKGIEEMKKLALELLDYKQILFCKLVGYKDWNELISDPKYQDKPNIELEKAIKDQLNNSLTPYKFLSKYGKEKLKSALILQASNLCDFPDEKVEYLVDPYIVKNGINLITGAPGSLKSMLIHYLSVTCVKGEKLFDEFDTCKLSKVLLLDQENIKAEIKSRILKFGGDINNFILPDNDIYFDTTKDLTKQIINLVKYEGIDLVVVDTLRRTNLKLDENNSKEVSAMYAELNKIKKHATVVVLHHENKAKDMKGNSSYRGSGDLVGAVDSYISIKKEKKTTCVYLTIFHRKARYSQEHDPVYVAFHYSDGRFTFNYQGTENEHKQNEKIKTREERVDEVLLELVNVAEKGMDTTEFNTYCKEAFDIGQHKAKQLRDLLVQEKKIHREDNHNGGKGTRYFHIKFSPQQVSTHIE